MFHKVKKGDTLSDLAESYGVTIQDIVAANPKIKDPDLIYEGDWIWIPVYSSWFTRFVNGMKKLFRI